MKKQHIKKSFLCRFLIIIASIVILGTAVVISVWNIQTTRSYTENINSIISTLYQSETGHYKWMMELRSALEGEKEFTGSTDPAQCILGKHIYSKEIQNNTETEELVSKIEPLHKEIHNLANDALALAGTDQGGAESIYKKDIMPRVEDLTGFLDTAISLRQEKITEAEESQNRLLLTEVCLVLLALTATLTACLNLYRYVKKQIVEPILHIAQTTMKLTDGNLDLDFSVPVSHEIGELGNVLNASVKDISEYIQEIDRAMYEFSNGNFDVAPDRPFIGDFKRIEQSISGFIVHMSKTLHSIMQSSQQVTVSAGQVAEGAQSLSQGSEEQSVSVEELNTAIHFISSHIEQTAQNADEAGALVNNTSEKMTACNRQMKDMVNAMTEISKKSGEIGNIIKTIEDIAFQTNVLALNVAIEAARAGEAGKGFAVVADEVRGLAGKSAEAAKNTAGLIEETIKAVGDGERLADLTADSLLEVMKGSAAVTERVTQITEAAKEQALSVNQVKMGMEQITAVVQTNTAAAQESAAIGQELTGQAELLKDLISRFRVSHQQQDMHEGI